LWWKWLYWKKGISTREFKNEYLNDIKDVIEINNAVEEKQLREQKVRSMMNNMR
jgi:hypothetical protein